MIFNLNRYGSQFPINEWQDFLKEHSLVASMSRRGNCHDNAVVESFFSCSNESACVVYANRDEARRDIFDYIDVFYNRIRRCSHNDGLSPVKNDVQFNQKLASV